MIIPCLNEEATITQVILEIQKNSPESRIVVVDNGSSDSTLAVAKKMGVETLLCRERGKARAVKMAIDHCSSDSYTLVDGDQTYDLLNLPEMIRLVQEGCAMTVGKRHLSGKNGEFPRFHAFGNFFFSTLITMLFGKKITDALSGLRVLSSDFVHSTPLTVQGFELEAFYTLQAVIRKLKVQEVPIVYRARPEGGSSKLRTFHDGFRILVCILKSFKNRRSLQNPKSKIEKAA